MAESFFPFRPAQRRRPAVFVVNRNGLVHRNLAHGDALPHLSAQYTGSGDQRIPPRFAYHVIEIIEDEGTLMQPHSVGRRQHRHTQQRIGLAHFLHVPEN